MRVPEEMLAEGLRAETVRVSLEKEQREEGEKPERGVQEKVDWIIERIWVEMGLEGFHLGKVIMRELLGGRRLPRVKEKVRLEVAPTVWLERAVVTLRKEPGEAVR